uniref:NfeD family protein n=1 Tax=uncultured Sphingomonas sp. TaxID=158754 RepID=UPI0035CBADFF
MMLFGFAWSPGALWLAAALGLVIAELLVPGFFLIFLGAAAAVVGVLVLIAPELPILVQAVVFAALTAGAVAAGKRWYRGSDRTSSDPLLNDRAARLIGKRVEVCEAIVDGEGRVKVGDGAWNAVGPDAAVGTSVRIVGADGSVLRVEPA